MKYAIILLCLCMLFSTSLFTQQQEKTYTLKESQLTEQQKAAAEASKSKEAVTSWTGVGKEVGIAMREGLSALNTEVNKFSESPAGQFTMFIIAWKVMGGTALRAVILIPLLLIGTIYFMFVFYRNCVVHQIVTEKSGFWLWGTRKYAFADLSQNGKSNSNLDLNMVRWAHWVAYAIFLGIIIIAISI